MKLRNAVSHVAGAVAVLVAVLLVLGLTGCWRPARTPVATGPATATPEPTGSVIPTGSVTPTPSPPQTPPTPTPTRTPVPSESQALAAIAKLDNARHGWGFVRRTDHTVPRVAGWISEAFGKYDTAYHGSTSSKNVYLTMDEGYENGFTGTILDTLAAKGVKAVFFCTGTFIRDNPDLVRRMVKEGHVVANHTLSHPNMVKKAKSYAAYRKELLDVEAAYRTVTGKGMPGLIRMPSGNWSVRALAYNEHMGYRTYFWSFAYRDWETANQPDPAEALDLILANTHPGEIMLLHAVSKTNTEILGDVIDGVRAQGYTFKLLSH
jgi:peptidoglycan-N-acetylmuramic acid deacetylase